MLVFAVTNTELTCAFQMKRFVTMQVCFGRHSWLEDMLIYVHFCVEFIAESGLAGLNAVLSCYGRAMVIPNGCNGGFIDMSWW